MTSVHFKDSAATKNGGGVYVGVGGIIDVIFFNLPDKEVKINKQKEK